MSRRERTDKKYRRSSRVKMSFSPEPVATKQPIRRLEIQINNFNVAIPHHVDLLKQHKNNIRKYEQQHDWERIRKEHINVSRIVKQLKELVYQMDTLRAQVLDTDIATFDKLTVNARTILMNTIKEYLELQLNLSAFEPPSGKNEDQETQRSLDNRYLQLQEEQEELQHRQACFHAWNSLQGDLQQLHQLFVEFNQIVHDQKEQVDTLEDNIEEAQVNVNKGEKSLARASKYTVVAYPLAGAFIGGCIGGPIGLIAGFKIGGLTALGCGILGFTGGSLLKRKEIETRKSAIKQTMTSSEEKSVKRTASLNESTREGKKEL